jgi:hypothetical protein
VKEKVEAMWSDSRFQLLTDLDRLLDSSKIWGGQEWVYNPIHPAKYRPMADRVRAELDKLYAEYGVKENKREKIDKAMREAFKDGVDLSGKETP